MYWEMYLIFTLTYTLSYVKDIILYTVIFDIDYNMFSIYNDVSRTV